MLLDRRRNEIVERGYADSLKNYRKKKRVMQHRSLKITQRRNFSPRSHFLSYNERDRDRERDPVESKKNKSVSLQRTSWPVVCGCGKGALAWGWDVPALLLTGSVTAFLNPHVYQVMGERGDSENTLETKGCERQPGSIHYFAMQPRLDQSHLCPSAPSSANWGWQYHQPL